MNNEKTLSQAGFTLTELLVAMVLVGILTTALYASYQSQKFSYEKQDDMSVVQQNLRAAMYYIGRDLRMAGCNPTGNPINAGFANVANSTQDNVTVSWDDDGDGALDAATEIISYRLSGNKLQRGVGDPVPAGGWQDICDCISSITFNFLDADGNPATTSIRSVNIQISGASNGEAKTLTSNVFCRNLGL